MCDWPDCSEKGTHDMEICNEDNPKEIMDVTFCRKHYIETMLYNGENPEIEGEELTEDERKYVYGRLGIPQSEETN